MAPGAAMALAALMTSGSVPPISAVGSPITSAASSAVAAKFAMNASEPGKRTAIQDLPAINATLASAAAAAIASSIEP